MGRDPARGSVSAEAKREAEESPAATRFARGLGCISIADFLGKEAVRFSRPLLSPIWCNVVKAPEATTMREKKSQGKSLKAQRKAAVRASISFPPDLYETLEEIAKQKKVSLAWVVREAAEQYLSEKWPLLRGQA